MVDDRPYDIQGVVAMNKVIQNLREEKKDDLAEFAYLVIALKYPRVKVGGYGKRKVIEREKESLVKCLEEKDRKQFDLLGKNNNTEIGVKALSNLGKTLSQDSQHTIDLYVYTMSAYPDTRISRQAALNLADMAYQKKDYQKAIYEYRWFLCRYPGYSQASRLWNRLGFSLQQAGQVKEALNAYERGIHDRFNDNSINWYDRINRRNRLYFFLVAIVSRYGIGYVSHKFHS